MALRRLRASGLRLLPSGSWWKKLSWFGCQHAPIQFQSRKMQRRQFSLSALAAASTLSLPLAESSPLSASERTHFFSDGDATVSHAGASCPATVLLGRQVMGYPPVWQEGTPKSVCKAAIAQAATPKINDVWVYLIHTEEASVRRRLQRRHRRWGRLVQTPLRYQQRVVIQSQARLTLGEHGAVLEPMKLQVSHQWHPTLRRGAPITSFLAPDGGNLWSWGFFQSIPLAFPYQDGALQLRAGGANPPLALVNPEERLHAEVAQYISEDAVSVTWDVLAEGALVETPWTASLAMTRIDAAEFYAQCQMEDEDE